MNELKQYNEADRVRDRDDFLYSLKSTMGFFGKDLDKMQASFWWTACNGKPLPKLKAALLEWHRVGKFAPKPVDILSLIDDRAAFQSQSETPAIPTTDCPPEIARAWMWFIKMRCEGSLLLSGAMGKREKLDSETEEKYMHAVNHEAHKYGMPDAIPDEYKLKEVWGA